MAVLVGFGVRRWLSSSTPHLAWPRSGPQKLPVLIAASDKPWPAPPVTNSNFISLWGSSGTKAPSGHWMLECLEAKVHETTRLLISKS